MSEEIKEWKILIGNMQNQLHEFNDKLMKLDESCDLANEISAENSNSIHNLLEHILNIDEVNKGHHEIIHEILLPKIKALEKRLETRIDTQHDSDMRSLDIIGINELDIRHIKSVLKELSAKDDPKHYEGDEKKDGV